MLKKDDWRRFTRDLDWTYSYATEQEVFPEVASGKPWLSSKEWKGWEEPFKTTFREYVAMQCEKDSSIRAVQDAVGRVEDYEKLSPVWLNALKLHSATFPLAEFAATIGNLRAARFGRVSAWRNMSLLGAMDETRHTQIPLLILHELLKWDAQFDWTHRFYHSNDWVAIAGRHMIDELLLASDPIEFAIATHFVFETGFTNLQFIGLTSLSHHVGDRMFEKMLGSIQTDEARHAQIGPAVLRELVKHDRPYAQRLVDKWFWRSWLLFAVVTGIGMDYLTPVEKRTQSFKEFVREWVLAQFLQSLDEYGLEKPKYWDTFLDSLESYHHMVYASAYTYRASVWFDFALPGPKERAWLAKKYPRYWKQLDPVWSRITELWSKTDPGNEFAVHGTAIVGFCNLCQLVLCGGTPEKNAASTLLYQGQKYIFCSDPCRTIFEQEPERYASHKDVVKRVLAGEAPANLVALLTEYMGLDYETWGKDVLGGDYPWMKRRTR